MNKVFPSKPNIVFILADDMGYGDFSAFNGGLSRTPTLDGLMAEASASPSSTPPRRSATRRAPAC